jgi:hypothetical protein
MNAVTVVAVIVAVAAVGIAAWAMLQVRTTRRLRDKFGPEYQYAVESTGDRRRAEAELAHREARVKKLHIRRLTSDERDHFTEAWREQQGRFVDDPEGATESADALLTELMHARGYPTGDFDKQLADASVDHSRVIGNYREAHDIAERSRNGKASTEDLRRAVICYRALFEELLGAPVIEHSHEEIRNEEVRK